MYVYENTKNPDDRYYERVVYKFMDGKDHFFVTKYDVKMRPVSTFTYWNNDGEINLMKANMKVGRLTYESKIQKNVFFPSDNKLAQVNFDYPANDTVVNLVEINRTFDRFDSIPDIEGNIDVVVFQDSIRVSLIDIKNKKTKTIPASVNTFYGRGMGKVMETNGDNTFKLILKTNYGTFQSIK